MAIGVYSTFKVYEPEFQTGMVEGLNQNVALFNEGTRGAIRLIPRALNGHYSKEAFFEDVASLVTRRDIGNVSTIADIDLTQDEVISVKINRKVGPVAKTLDSMRKAGLSEADASRAFGKLAATRKLKDMVNTAIIGLEAAIEGNTAMNLDITSESTKTASVYALNRTLAKFGDAAGDIVFFLFHSKVLFDVTNGQITGGVSGIADLVSFNGAQQSILGRGWAMTDCPALTDANGSATDTYNTLGLVSGACEVTESEPDVFATDSITDKENLAVRWRSEHAFNVKVKGFKWNTTGGGVNPSDSTLGTTSNWTQVAYDDKLTAGVRLDSQ
ncbi:MAG TPA: major capsid protein [Gemmatimonadaceae bacterium]|nr:major capsid protein [Gemmatimonadaceae bacterium]